MQRVNPHIVIGGMNLQIRKTDGVSFAEAWGDSEKDKLDGLPVRFISAKMFETLRLPELEQVRGPKLH